MMVILPLKMGEMLWVIEACKTANAFFVPDNQGVTLEMSTPQEGQHHDLFEIQTLFNEICTILKEAGISLDGGGAKR